MWYLYVVHGGSVYSTCGSDGCNYEVVMHFVYTLKQILLV